MGAIFRPKYTGRDGVVRESAVWWARFRQHGKTVRQSTETADERKAQAVLREKEGKVALNIRVSPSGDRLTLDAAAAMIRTTTPRTATSRPLRSSFIWRICAPTSGAPPGSADWPPATSSGTRPRAEPSRRGRRA
jgi:hypothetical protein